MVLIIQLTDFTRRIRQSAEKACSRAVSCPEIGLLDYVANAPEFCSSKFSCFM